MTEKINTELIWITNPSRHRQQYELQFKWHQDPFISPRPEEVTRSKVPENSNCIIFCVTRKVFYRKRTFSVMLLRFIECWVIHESMNRNHKNTYPLKTQASTRYAVFHRSKMCKLLHQPFPPAIVFKSTDRIC
ncbi:unnamed protein product [Nesidiocoris tenuis]|uniref:Uncharacterized protein n=1 Tax=Nesidiocoris tenuis TaxID=355587 RepID=A0A6H5GYB6_9HEMI|nr:unnamed protein product [Nesidiocoris tenuis]